ncbi:MAG: lysophospholipid acyltransferase family protein, partial [Acidobacteriota bacterium]
MKREDRFIPQSSSTLSRWFSWYVKGYFRKHFDAVRLSRSGRIPVVDGPLLVYANHPSWWDPILFCLLTAELFPHRRAFGPMDAAALEKYPLLKKLGVFGVEQGSYRGAARFLQTSEAILTRDDSLLWLTAEGSFSDPRQR